jgi:pSer/pThr/pTyr-binding forkhead associated (FHA) protein
MFVLRGVTGGAFGRSYALTIPATVGRSPDCDIHIDAPGLSRLHARLVPTADGVIVEDLESTNGTFVNGYRVRRWQSAACWWRWRRWGLATCCRHRPRALPPG